MGIRSPRAALLAALLVSLGSACAYRSAPVEGLCIARTLRTKPFEQSRVVAADLEDIVFENGSDLLWVADDNVNQIYVFDSDTGRFRARLREVDFLKAFPDARNCDNGSASVECHYTREFESLAYDRNSRTLYVENTVNKLDQTPAVDKPALYRLQSAAKGENLRFVDWKPMPEGLKYGALVVIGDQLHVAVHGEIYAYDYEQNRIADETGGTTPQPAYKGKHGAIVGMASEGAYLWILYQDTTLAKVDWKAKEEVAHYELSEIGLTSAKGLAFGRGEFFVVEGLHPNPIYVLHFATPSSFGRARFLGGWPRSCPSP